MIPWADIEENMKKSRPSPNESNLRELIVHIASLSDRDESFGAVKLNKLLFRMDFDSYLLWGKPLTGVDYFALENGPAPRPMKRLLKMMESKGDIAIRRSDYFGRDQNRVLPLRTAELGDRFSVEELNLIVRVVHFYWGRSGTSLSTESHEFMGWALAKREETIPYDVALVGDRDPTLDEIARGTGLESLALECLTRNVASTSKTDHRRTSL